MLPMSQTVLLQVFARAGILLHKIQLGECPARFGNGFGITTLWLKGKKFGLFYRISDYFLPPSYFAV